MKKLILLLTILNCSLTLAQEKTFSFDKKVSYKLLIPEEYKEYYLALSNNKEPYLAIYSGKNALIGSTEGFSYFDGFNTNAFFATNGKIFDVTTNSLENDISIKLPVYNDWDSSSNNKAYSTNFFGEDLKIQKLNTTETINEYTCNNYELISISSEDFSQKTVICIDEKNEINNIGLLLPKEKIKGLIVKATADQESGFIIDKISNSSLKSTFNEQKSIDDYIKALDKLKTEYENDYNNLIIDSAVAPEVAYYDDYYNDPINSYYEYANSENDKVNSIFYSLYSVTSSIVTINDVDRNKALNTAEGSTKQIVKQYKKNSLIDNKEAKELNKMLKIYFEAAKNYVPTQETDYATVVAIDDDIDVVEIEESYDPYLSTYKKLDLDNSLNNFAYTGYSDQESLMNTMPKYCSKTTIPDFKNTEFKKNVENYFGQLCDLYISKFVYNVGITETTDALRYSFIKINELKNKLSKDDQTKYDLYINSLD